MKVYFSKKFEKELDKITDPSLKKNVSKAVKILLDANSLVAVPNLKKMKGQKNAYRIRVGNYRIGFYLEKSELFIVTVAHRSDIYKYFP
ncbi:MAG: type II toxin-antitoxin system RelE/ParE family toxin [Bacteroidetes bacterium]|nr:type II toxin-antitoxin system RelE/ParE family toxin [Bacteroidota bacterium]